MVVDIVLTPEEQEELTARTRAQSLRNDDVRRARLILMLSRGDSYSDIEKALDCQPSYIVRWKTRSWRTGSPGYIRDIGVAVRRNVRRNWKHGSCTGRQRNSTKVRTA